MTTRPAPDVPELHEFHLPLAGREWAVLHAGMALTYAEEQAFLRELREGRRRVTYGAMLWPSAIALAHELAARGAEDPGAFAGRTVLELGAGTGLPGIVAAAALGARRVVQTDRDEVALVACRRNAERNGLPAGAAVEHRPADWEHWRDLGRYDWVLGSDVLYAEPLHPHLRRILEASLAPGGRALLADPFRVPSLRFLESLEADGWRVSFTRWNLGGAEAPAGGAGVEDGPRPVGVFELSPPA